MPKNIHMKAKEERYSIKKRMGKYPGKDSITRHEQIWPLVGNPPVMPEGLLKSTSTYTNNERIQTKTCLTPLEKRRQTA